MNKLGHHKRVVNLPITVSRIVSRGLRNGPIKISKFFLASNNHLNRSRPRDKIMADQFERGYGTRKGRFSAAVGIKLEVD